MSCDKVSNIVGHSLGLIVVDQVASWDPTSKNKHTYWKSGDNSFPKGNNIIGHKLNYVYM